MRAEHGQGTIEYLAVVLVIAGVLAAAVAAATALGIGPAVVRELRHALCIVTGAACGRKVQLADVPCVIASERRAQGGHIDVTVVRIGDRSVVLREQLADGRVRLTLVEENEAGIDLGTGAGAHLRWGSFERAVGAELRMALLAQRGSGRVWLAPDEASAARILEQARLARLGQPAETTVEGAPALMPSRPAVHAPEPDATFTERGSSLELDLRVRGGAAVHLSHRDAYGERVDRATGNRTVYVRGALDGEGGVAFGRDAVGLTGRGAGEERYAVTLDRDGRPLDLMVLSTLDVDGAVGLPPGLSRIAGRLKIPTSGEKHVETEQHLDLTDPASAEIAHAFLGSLGEGRIGVRATAAALRDRLKQDGTLNIRTYASSETAHEGGAHVKVLGLGLGGEGGSRDASSHLVAAVTQAPDGTWGVDEACALTPAGAV
jgi:hypothetical protein